MSFNSIINQDKAKQIIASQLRLKRIPHAYLFLGQEGVGRKKFALELAKALNCMHNENSPQQPCDTCVSCRKIDARNHPDVTLVDFAWQAHLENKDEEKQKAIKIDTIRALQKEVNLKPTEGKWKVFIIEPAEKITLDAANSLLKTLEEPPAQTILILLALHKDNLPATVVSRTQIIPFSPLADKELAALLTRTYSLSLEEAADIAAVAEGSIYSAAARINGDRDAVEAVWEQVKKKGIPALDLLALSQEHQKESAEFLENLLTLARKDFREYPHRYRQAVEAIMHSQKLLEKNVNPQMILDTLLLRLNTQ